MKYDMDAPHHWLDFFRNWPADLPQQGVIVTSFDEQIAFEGFLYNDRMLIAQRRAPDTLGARMVVLPYEEILAVKLVDVVRQKVLTSAGFSGSLPKK